MTATYEKIATTTLGSAAATVTFSSISGSYTDLVLICSASNSGASSINIAAQVNSDTASNYSSTRLFGSGAVAGSDRQTSNTSFISGRSSATGNSKAVSICNFQNYSNTTTYKTMISRGNDAASITAVSASLWQSTSAINSILLLSLSAVNFEAGSTFTLYGIKAE